MKRNSVLFLFCIIISCIFAQNFTLDGRYRVEVNTGLARFDILTDNFVYIFIDDSREDLTVKFNIVHIEGMTFLKLSDKIPKEVTEAYLYLNQKNIVTDDKILILAGKVSNRENPLIIATTSGFNKAYPLTVPIISEQVRVYKDASSYLIEKTKSYPVENLNKIAADTPWVENAPGYGIGESFVIENSWGKVYTTLLIMNGYISYEKPYLYKQNGRIKQIKVTGVKSGNSRFIDVLDTPHPQTVDISFITEAEDIKVEIADVYEGTKYEDTCIHYMITYTNEVIPYENEIGE